MNINIQSGAYRCPVLIVNIFLTAPPSPSQATALDVITVCEVGRQKCGVELESRQRMGSLLSQVPYRTADGLECITSEAERWEWLDNFGGLHSHSGVLTPCQIYL